VVDPDVTPLRGTAPRVDYQTQQELLWGLEQAGTPAERATRLRDALRAPQAGWWLFERLAEAGLGHPDLRVGAAALLADPPADDSPAAQTRWLRWLAEDAWRRGNYVEAAVLAGVGADIVSAEMPRPPIARLAAAWQTGHAAHLLEDVSYQDLTQAERTVVAGVALVELLLRGSETVLGVLEDNQEALPQTWRGAADEAAQYWRQAYRPLPMAVIRADLQTVRDQEDMRRAWSSLADDLTPLEQTNFRYDSGPPTRDYLYRTDQPLGRLRALLASRDADGVNRLLIEEKERLANLERFLDAATRAADPNLDLIEGVGRTSFLGKLRAILKAAKAVARYARPAGEAGDADWVEAARAPARVLYQRWQELDQEALAAARPEGLLLIRALAELGEVRQWGAGDAATF